MRTPIHPTRTSHPTRTARTTGTAAAALLSLALSGCSLIGTGDDPVTASGSGQDGAPSGGGKVVLVTHDSFFLPKQLVKDFEEESGYDLQLRASGDAGALTSQLVLNTDSPIGDVAFGVDNTFGSRALDADVFAPVEIDAPDGVEAHRLPGDDEGALTPVDTGNVCVNVDTTWFDERDLDAPETLDDLTDPAYEGLFVTSGATTSSPGFAFLLATIAAYGDDWTGYWEDLLANDTAVVKGWEDAYQVDFTQGGGKGDRPIVTSYDSSPAFTVDGDGGTTTRALLDTCYEQVEYAGMLRGADNPAGAQAVVEWLLSPEVQQALPGSMYVYPVVEGTDLPAEWADLTERPDEPWAVDPDEIDENRDAWLREWGDLVSR
ncbi:thiamine ABC transporter substrate-binding protein [Nocardioides dokdonensis]|nr:thiamine ABC transporter substrate-binding protein [Nocardioides dokdonensis]